LNFNINMGLASLQQDTTAQNGGNSQSFADILQPETLLFYGITCPKLQKISENQ